MIIVLYFKYTVDLLLFHSFNGNTRQSTYLTLSWRRPLSYRNQTIDLLCKIMGWFLYDEDLRHGRVKLGIVFSLIMDKKCNLLCNQPFNPIIWKSAKVKFLLSKKHQRKLPRRGKFSINFDHDWWLTSKDNEVHGITFIFFKKTNIFILQALNNQAFLETLCGLLTAFKNSEVFFLHVSREIVSNSAKFQLFLFGFFYFFW